MDGEARLPLHRVPAQHEHVGGRGVAQGAGVELPVLKHLRVPERDRLAGRAVGAQAQAPGVVLAEVQQPSPAPLVLGRHGEQFIGAAHGRPGRGD